jgi:beta-N-acetylhexosaminidase
MAGKGVCVNDDLHRAIGQMILTGFRGLSLPDNDPLAADLREGRVGSLVLFDFDVARKAPIYNIESPRQVRELTATLQRLARLPLLIAIDQEGGRVNRLKEERGFPATLSARALGELDSRTTTALYADATARCLSDVGINLNLSPVVDLDLNPDNPIIGRMERSYGADPGKVVAHAVEVITAHHRQGILCTLKHFPGQGSAAKDTHWEFVDATAAWRDIELDPYRQIIEAGLCDAIMTSHIYNARIDPEYPATLSKRTVTGILRDRLGFDGVVISDDLQMRAISRQFGLEIAVEKAIDAGVDILSFANNIDDAPLRMGQVTGIILDLLKQRKLRETRLEESVARIRRLKDRAAKP